MMQDSPATKSTVNSTEPPWVGLLLDAWSSSLGQVAAQAPERKCGRSAEDCW
jgi:hypothetical protein